MEKDKDRQILNSNGLIKVINKAIDMFSQDPTGPALPVALVYLETEGIEKKVMVLPILDSKEGHQEILNLLSKYFIEGYHKSTELIRPCLLCDGRGYYLVGSSKHRCQACNGKGTTVTEVKDEY